MRYYKVNDNPEQINEEEIMRKYFDDPCDFEDYERADQSLDETYCEYEIAGVRFSPSKILYECDETAYNDYVYEEAEDYLDSLKSDIEYEIQRLDEDESVRFEGYTITFLYDDDVTEEDDDELSLDISELIA